MIIEGYLKKIRLSFGYSQAKVARGIEISPQSYNRYERGERKLNLEIVEKLANFYNVSVLHFLSISPEKEFIPEWELEDQPNWMRNKNPLHTYSLVDIAYQFEECFIKVNDAYKKYRSAVKSHSKNLRNNNEKYYVSLEINDLKSEYKKYKEQLKYYQEMNNLIIGEKLKYILSR